MTFYSINFNFSARALASEIMFNVDKDIAHQLKYAEKLGEAQATIATQNGQNETTAVAAMATQNVLLKQERN